MRLPTAHLQSSSDNVGFVDLTDGAENSNEIQYQIQIVFLLPKSFDQRVLCNNEEMPLS